MVRKDAYGIGEVRENMRGGDGSVTIEHYFQKDEINAVIRLCAELILPSGLSVAKHEYVGEDENYTVKKGKGIISDPGVDIEINPVE